MQSNTQNLSSVDVTYFYVLLQNKEIGFQKKFIVHKLI